MEKKKSTAVFAAAAVGLIIVLAAGVFGFRAWADSRTEALRTETVIYIEDTKLANYETEDRAQVKEIMERYIEAVWKADDEAAIEAARAEFDEALEAVETAGAKLDAARAKAIEEVEGWKLSAYDKAGKAEIRKLMEKYTGRIQSAISAGEIQKLLKQFRSAAGKVMTKAEKEEQERLEEEKRKQEEQEAKEAEQNSAAPPKAASKSAAQQYVGGSAAAMAAAIGQPASKSYSASCLGPGQDGVWYYSGFTVYTYKEGGSETVMSVE